ncbi:hypothetical protein [Amycolatopsis thailandensis]|uniref:DUF320 domain-containing protein n=1 Tax=Amycolatopsis thailandensis TaxID=589330 RepID=A0A229RBX4_9PSEU|nr:hypothetical protein [Amycolatopsis thailandensis]OXM44147.1 hypothetical protein CFP71_40875 [Amycolatopsis thailandensis]
MRERTRRATALGASAFILAGSAALAMPGTAAAAETKTAACGGSVTAKPGDKIVGKTLLGLPVDLGTVGPVSTILTGVLGTVCKVTVTVVNAVVAPVPVIGEPAAEALNGAVTGTTQALTGGGKPAPGTQPQPQPQKPGTGTPGAGNPQTGGPAGTPAQGGTPAGGGIPAANSPLLPGTFTPNFGGLPFGISTGYAPMRDYSSIPMATAGLFSPSPGIRYGGQIPGYAPQFGIAAEGENAAGNPDIQNAGQAEALPNVSNGFTQDGKLPLLIAVLALSGVSAGLVRTWVLRRMAATS